MKKLLTVLTLVWVLTGCGLFFDYNWVFPGQITSVSDALYYMYHVEYKSERGDHWALPHETYNSNSGDCEDQAALLANMMIYKLGMNARLVGAVHRFSGTGHMAVECDGRFYEATGGYENPSFERYFKVVIYYSYEDYCRMSQTIKE